MPRRQRQEQDSPFVVEEPRFLAREDMEGDALVLDAHAADRHLLVRAEGPAEVRQGRPSGLRAVAGAEPPRPVASAPAGANGHDPYPTAFDRLFRRHRGTDAGFAPFYGQPADAFEVFRAWTYAHALREYLPTRPIAVFTGPPGATKSTTAAAVGQLWYGLDAPCARPMRLRPAEADFLGLLVHNPLLVLDNVEATPPWLADVLCIVSSGEGRLVTRRYYSTAGTFEVVPDCFVALTGINTQGLARGDVLERCLVFRLSVPAEYIDRAAWRAEVARARFPFWQEAIEAVAAVRRAAVRRRAGHANGTSADATAPGVRLRFDRLQDFAWVGEAVCGHFGGEAGARRFRRGMAAVALARVALASDDTDVAALLALATHAGPERWYTSGELVRAAGEALGPETHGFDSTARNAQSLGLWVARTVGKVQGGVVVHRRFLHGQRQWRFELASWIEAAGETLRRETTAADAPAASATGAVVE